MLLALDTLAEQVTITSAGDVVQLAVSCAAQELDGRVRIFGLPSTCMPHPPPETFCSTGKPRPFSVHCPETDSARPIRQQTWMTAAAEHAHSRQRQLEKELYPHDGCIARGEMECIHDVS